MKSIFKKVLSILILSMTSHVMFAQNPMRDAFIESINIYNMMLPQTKEGTVYEKLWIEDDNFCMKVKVTDYNYEIYKKATPDVRALYAPLLYVKFNPSYDLGKTMLKNIQMTELNIKVTAYASCDSEGMSFTATPADITRWFEYADNTVDKQIDKWVQRVNTETPLVPKDIRLLKAETTSMNAKVVISVDVNNPEVKAALADADTFKTFFKESVLSSYDWIPEALLTKYCKADMAGIKFVVMSQDRELFNFTIDLEDAIVISTLQGVLQEAKQRLGQ